MIYNSDTLSFQIPDAYRYSHPDGHFFVKARPFASLSFRISGLADFRFGDKSLAAKPGNVMFVPSGVPFEVEYLGSEYFVIELADCHYGEPELISLKNPTEIFLLFSDLLQAWGERQSANRAKSGVYAILSAIEEDQMASMENTALAQCLGYIEEHFCDPDLNIGAVCRHCFISVSSLQRAFLAHFGVSPMQYIIKRRMGKAVRLLSQNRLSVKEIAGLCGFSDEKYFSRAFKRMYGYPPSKLREGIIL